MKVPNAQERRQAKRQYLSSYFPVMDINTHETIGHLADISSFGFMVVSKIPIPSSQDYNLRVKLLEAISGKPSLDFIARSKWCRSDLVQPQLYNAGFEITSSAPDDFQIIKRIAKKYGTG